MEIKKMTYEELDGKVAVTKSSIFATKFKIEKLQAELLQQETQLKKLREAKWLKICDDVKPTLLDGNFDIALDDLQAFLQTKKVADAKSQVKISSQKK